jgi:hypothetical protein
VLNYFPNIQLALAVPAVNASADPFHEDPSPQPPFLSTFPTATLSSNFKPELSTAGGRILHSKVDQELPG